LSTRNRSCIPRLCRAQGAVRTPGHRGPGFRANGPIFTVYGLSLASDSI
jgi:hypothetical protein